MSKAFYSPGRILRTTLEKYLVDEQLTTVLKDCEKLELKMKAIAFSIKTLASHFGRQIDSKVEKDVIIFDFCGIEIYRLSNEQVKHVNEPQMNKRINEVSVDVEERFWINLFFHYGNMLGVLDRMGVGSQSQTDRALQTSIAV